MYVQLLATLPLEFKLAVNRCNNCITFFSYSLGYLILYIDIQTLPFTGDCQHFRHTEIIQVYFYCLEVVPMTFGFEPVAQVRIFNLVKQRIIKKNKTVYSSRSSV